ncbi:hypothetical protein GCM10027343_39800 [Noviherbaspirillum agri]
MTSPDNYSLREQGRTWPPHRIAGSESGQFPRKPKLPRDTRLILKAASLETDAYLGLESGFEGTELARVLCREYIERVFIIGLATDY